MRAPFSNLDFASVAFSSSEMSCFEIRTCDLVVVRFSLSILKRRMRCQEPSVKHPSHISSFSPRCQIPKQTPTGPQNRRCKGKLKDSAVQKNQNLSPWIRPCHQGLIHAPPCNSYCEADEVPLVRYQPSTTHQLHRMFGHILLLAIAEGALKRERGETQTWTSQPDSSTPGKSHGS